MQNLSLEGAMGIDKAVRRRKEHNRPIPQSTFKPSLFRQPSLAEGRLRPSSYRKHLGGNESPSSPFPVSNPAGAGGSSIFKFGSVNDGNGVFWSPRHAGGGGPLGAILEEEGPAAGAQGEDGGAEEEAREEVEQDLSLLLGDTAAAADGQRRQAGVELTSLSSAPSTPTPRPGVRSHQQQQCDQQSAPGSSEECRLVLGTGQVGANIRGHALVDLI